MRPIHKQGQGPHHLDNAHANPPTTAHDAKTRWSSFAHKAAVQARLLDEQFMLCAYSEIRADLEGIGVH